MGLAEKKKDDGDDDDNDDVNVNVNVMTKMKFMSDIHVCTVQLSLFSYNLYYW